MVINALNSGASTYMADFEGTVSGALLAPAASPPPCARARRSRRGSRSASGAQRESTLVRPPDSNTPTWENNLSGHVNLRDANRRTINYAAGGKQYRLNAKVATLIVRCGDRPPRARAGRPFSGIGPARVRPGRRRAKSAGPVDGTWRSSTSTSTACPR